MSGIRVRSAAFEDLADVERVRIASWRAAYRGPVPDQVLDGLVLTAERLAGLQERWESGAMDLVVAEADGQVVGFAIAGPARDEDLTGVRELYAIYLLPEAWGLGSGRALLEAAGDVRVVWMIEGNTRARRFYERQGFVTDGTRRLLPRWEEGSPPEVRYVRT